MTTTRRSWIKSVVAMVCGGALWKSGEKASLLAQGPSGPPLSYIVVADWPLYAANHPIVPPLGSKFTVTVMGKKCTRTLVARSASQMNWHLCMGQPQEWLVACDWVILPRDGLTTETEIA